MIYREVLSAEGRLLTLAMLAELDAGQRVELTQSYSALGADRVRSIAQLNQVDALVGFGLESGGVGIPAAWHEAVIENGRRVESLVEALAAVVARLEAVGVPSAAIEAGGVLLGSDLDYRGYCPGDIDLLVDARGWDRVPAAFAAEGFLPRVRRGRPTRRIEFHRDLGERGEQWLEAGCEPFDRMWVPLRVRDCAQEWLAGRVPARKGRGISVLHPSEALAFLAIHTSLHAYVRAPGLRLHVDVDRVVRDNAVDWDCFTAAVTKACARRRAFVSLAMARGILGTPIPDTVLRGLSPGARAWRRIEALLSFEGVVASGRPKLGRWRGTRLDLLLDDEGVLPWVASVIAPPTAWMREHFDRGGTGASTWRLHARRIKMAVGGWRPE